LYVTCICMYSLSLRLSLPLPPSFLHTRTPPHELESVYLSFRCVAHVRCLIFHLASANACYRVCVRAVCVRAFACGRAGVRACGRAGVRACVRKWKTGPDADFEEAVNENCVAIGKKEALIHDLKKQLDQIQGGVFEQTFSLCTEGYIPASTCVSARVRACACTRTLTSTRRRSAVS
jgi:hypothetical protein